MYSSYLVHEGNIVHVSGRVRQMLHAAAMTKRFGIRESVDFLCRDGEDTSVADISIVYVHSYLMNTHVLNLSGHLHVAIHFNVSLPNNTSQCIPGLSPLSSAEM